MADIPEPELGWPWAFFSYGNTFGGYGPVFEPESLAYDLAIAVLILVGVGYAVWRIIKQRRGPAQR